MARSRVVVIAALAGSWALGLVLKGIVGTYVTKPSDPMLPLVSLPVGTTDDVMSSVPILFLTLVGAAICALVVEIAKVRSHQAARPPWRGYSALLAYQVVLIADLFRSYAHDWWIWTLSWIDLRELTSNPIEGDIIELKIPWVSGIFAALVAGYFSMHWHRSRDDRSAAELSRS